MSLKCEPGVQVKVLVARKADALIEAGGAGRLRDVPLDGFSTEYSFWAALAVHPTPYTLHPTPYTLHPPTPYTLHPTHYTLHRTPNTLHPTPYAQHPTPYTLHPTPYTLHPTPGVRGRNGSGWLRRRTKTRYCLRINCVHLR